MFGSTRIDAALSETPILAVLRGLPPEDAETVGDALVSAGVAALEVTLDSPDPHHSIRLLKASFGDRAVVAAGTVMTAEQANLAASAGAEAIVAPNFAREVVRAAKEAGRAAIPGVLTPTEAFLALNNGADALKIFPGEAASPGYVKALKAVLPAETALVVTGGVTLETIGAYLSAGAAAVGMGSALYKPGEPAGVTAEKAAAVVAAVRAARA